jgi:hypothetical protein
VYGIKEQSSARKPQKLAAQLPQAIQNFSTISAYNGMEQESKPRSSSVLNMQNQKSP